MSRWVVGGKEASSTYIRYTLLDDDLKSRIKFWGDLAEKLTAILIVVVEPILNPTY